MVAALEALLGAEPCDALAAGCDLVPEPRAVVIAARAGGLLVNRVCDREPSPARRMVEKNCHDGATLGTVAVGLGELGGGLAIASARHIRPPCVVPVEPHE